MTVLVTFLCLHQTYSRSLFQYPVLVLHMLRWCLADLDSVTHVYFWAVAAAYK